MAYDITGKVEELKETQVFPSGFSKRELILLDESGKFTQTISLEFLKDSISKLDEVSVGDTVTVGFDVRGRAHNDRVYNSLVGWKISVDSKAEAPVVDPNQPRENSEGAFENEIPF